MAHGIILKTALAASNVDAFNRFAKAEFDVDNGNIFQLLAKTTEVGEAEVWEATKPAEGAGLYDLWMAAEPEYVGVNTGSKVFMNIDVDPRDFYIKAGTVFSAFKPHVGDIITLTGDAFEGELEEHQYLVAAADSAKLTPADAAIAGLSLKLIGTSYISLPEGYIGDTQRVTAYEFEVVAVDAAGQA